MNANRNPYSKNVLFGCDFDGFGVCQFHRNKIIQLQRTLFRKLPANKYFPSINDS